MPLLRFRRPAQEETDVAGNASRERDDHGLQLEALRLAELEEALIELPGLALQRVRSLYRALAYGAFSEHVFHDWTLATDGYC